MADCDDIFPENALPFGQNNDPHLRVDGINVMRAPLGFLSNRDLNCPGLYVIDEPRTGWKAEAAETLLAVIDCQRSFLIEQGILSWFFGTNKGSLEHSNTADRVYTFPDKSGTISLREDFEFNEEPSGVKDGINTTFTLMNIPDPPGNLRLYRNGLLQKQGDDYTRSGVTLTISPPPASTESLLAWYRI